MTDFTLQAYRVYLQAIKSSYANVLTFADFFSHPGAPDAFFIIRHDVDRKPQNALKMALLEREMGIRSTYYFRTRHHVFKPDIISKIADIGHEIGYHYECLSDAKGDYLAALTDFEKNLRKLRNIAPINTIAMHGSPLSQYDNRDLWRIEAHRKILKNRFGIYGEVYLDIDYANIAYISDTGRNWFAGHANRRDKVSSYVKANFQSGQDLLDCLLLACYPKVVFQIHPERWTNSAMEYFTQWAKDYLSNFVKALIKMAFFKGGFK